MSGVGDQVVLRAVAAVEEVGEAEVRRSGAEDRARREVEDAVEGDKAVESGDHGLDLGGVGSFLNLEENDVRPLERRRRTF